MRRTLLLFVLGTLAGLAQPAPPIAGDWKGTLDVPGAKLTLIFHISEPAPGEYQAAMEVPEQKAALPVRTVTHTASDLTLDLPDIRGKFEGKVQPDGKSARGVWKQAGLELPLTLEAFDGAAVPAPDTSDITAWLREHAIPLKTVEAGNGFEDMAPLKQVIGDARIVSVGEATHGTREFFQLKHRLFEFLVEQMGFTVFAIEANMPEARRVNEYVLEGKGDPAAALAGLYFWTWNTEEVLALVHWMREYNANPTHTKKVRFYGFDMQAAHVAAANAIAYLRRNDPDYAATAAQLLDPLSTDEKELALSNEGADTKKKVLQAATEMVARFDTVSQKDAGWRQARQDALIVQQAVGMLAAGNAGSPLRDEAMAANVSWILDGEGPEAKIMLWAHNEHVKAVSEGGFRSMGSHLRQRYGSQMVVFGFAFNQGAFRAVELGRGLNAFTVDPAPAGSLDSALAATKIPLAAVDLRPAQGLAREWLRSPQKTRTIGAVFSSAMASVLPEHAAAQAFDGILFVEKTSASRGLPALPSGSAQTGAPKR